MEGEQVGEVVVVAELVAIPQESSLCGEDLIQRTTDKEEWDGKGSAVKSDEGFWWPALELLPEVLKECFLGWVRLNCDIWVGGGNSGGADDPCPYLSAIGLGVNAADGGEKWVCPSGLPFFFSCGAIGLDVNDEHMLPDFVVVSFGDQPFGTRPGYFPIRPTDTNSASGTSLQLTGASTTSSLAFFLAISRYNRCAAFE